MSSGAYEWPVLVSLKHAVGLSQHWFSKFLLQEWFRESHSKLMACSPTCHLTLDVAWNWYWLSIQRSSRPQLCSEPPHPMVCTYTTLLAPWNAGLDACTWH